MYTCLRLKIDYTVFMESLYKCPWCGNTYENGTELHMHAKKHYNKKVLV